MIIQAMLILFLGLQDRQSLDKMESKKLLRESEVEVCRDRMDFIIQNVKTNDWIGRWENRPASAMVDKIMVFRGKYRTAEMDGNNKALVFDVTSNMTSLLKELSPRISGPWSSRDSRSEIRQSLNKDETKKETLKRFEKGIEKLEKEIKNTPHTLELTIPAGSTPPNKIKWVTATVLVRQVLWDTGSYIPSIKIKGDLIESKELGLRADSGTPAQAVNDAESSRPPDWCFAVNANPKKITIKNCGIETETILSVTVDDVYRCKFDPEVELKAGEEVQIDVSKFAGLKVDSDHIPESIMIQTPDYAEEVDIADENSF